MKSTNDNIKLGISNADYHAMEGLSKTSLDWLNRSPAHFKCWSEQPPQATAAMEKGVAFHLAALEPDLYDIRISVWTGGRKYGKAWDEFSELNKEKVIISDQDHLDITAMVSSIQAHPAANLLLTKKERLIEASIFSEIANIKCKARPDLIIGQDCDLLVDLKSTVNASPQEFTKAIYNFRYHVQAAFGLDVTAKAFGEDPQLPQLSDRRFIFVAVEKDPPYAVGVYEAEPEVIELGRRSYQQNLQTYMDCLETNRWPAYSDYIIPIGLPPWAKKREGIYE